ncbi:Tat (twin-arginine translocation) pathway signal sequence [Dehalogenimonas formicexedens]|uniref:Tat (Twin-arginine translocation) pathway signal sequence n=1 Tax=Dehalogenimonas formicexedens TaxID=1839801 RepID=A0A1P8F8I0_9CHLR|nr:multicopper oxidase domain-containing protein [Dehalogenimonas formicexedens]APV44758.1 Tat (twin-arginine translocation) pathway signal sequence [Dehalogenimonas formicexedens]
MEKFNFTRMTRRSFIKATGLAGAALGTIAATGLQLVDSKRVHAANLTDASFTPQTPLEDSTTIEQFAQPLPLLSVAGGPIQTIVAGASQIGISMEEFRARMLPDSFAPASGGNYDGTWVWGYLSAGTDKGPTRETYTGPVLVATRGKPTEFKFTNNLGTTDSTQIQAYTYSIDQSLHWANPNGVPRYVEYDTPDPKFIGNPAHYSGPIPAAVHLHGAEDPAAIDGGPESWFVSDGSKVGKAFYSKDGNSAKNYCIYRYPNVQEAAPLWFHDHTLGATRLNVYCGLAGAYALIDPNLSLPPGLNATGLRGGALGPNPSDDTLVPLVIQDRKFDTDGQLYFTGGPDDPDNPSPTPDHLYWSPEFFGNTIAVNGKVWPYLEVKAQRYRFFLINGSNARTYRLTFQDTAATVNSAHPVIWQIGTDQGYLDKPVRLTELMVMPGERAEFIIDFAGLSDGTKLVLNNLGPDSPFGGDLNDQAVPSTTGRVMQFVVVSGASLVDTSFDPSVAGASIRSKKDAIVRLVDPAAGTLAKGVVADLTRSLVLVEIAKYEPDGVNLDGKFFAGGPAEVLVNNSKWMGLRPSDSDPNEMMRPPLIPVNGGVADGVGNWLTELPKEGDTEIWEIVNTTMDAHPIHTHLAQFQLMNRQSFYLGDGAPDGYQAVYNGSFPGSEFIPAYGPPLSYGPSTASGNKYGGNPDVSPFLDGDVLPPKPNEAGWKDTVLALPGYVTRFVVRWAATDLGIKNNSNAASLRYDFIPNDAIPGRSGAIYDYVWHCHIVDHEDNEMMRPDAVVPDPRTPLAARKFKMGIDY